MDIKRFNVHSHNWLMSAIVWRTDPAAPGSIDRFLPFPKSFQKDGAYMMPEHLPRGIETSSRERPHAARWADCPQDPAHCLSISALLNTLVMPRKRRPTPPAPGSLPVRNIAPKPDPDQPNPVRPKFKLEDTNDQVSLPSISNSKGSDAEADFCEVPQCTIANCRLVTHLNYGRQRRLQHTIQFRVPSASTEELALLTLQPSPDLHLTLPLHDTPNRDFHRLFTSFFLSSGSFDRLVLVGRPTQQRNRAFKQTIYRLALENPIYCLTIVALSHMEIIKEALPTTIDPEADRLTDTIYTKLLTMTREKVSNLEDDNETDIDILLYAIVALCEYDLKLDRHDALRSHHIGMTALVSKRGGVHNLGLSLPYVLRMDRLLAVRSNQIPQFASPELPTSELLTQQQPSPVSHRGASFRDEASLLSQPIRTICSSAAHLLAIMDDLNVTSDPSKTSGTPSPKLEYFYFLRESIDSHHALLNHQLHTALESASKDRTASLTSANIIRKDFLALTAMRIVTGSHQPIVNDTLATRLWNLLTKPSTSSPRRQNQIADDIYVPTISLADWTDDMPLLLWLLFACALPGSRDGTLTFVGHLTPQSSTQLYPSRSPSSCSPEQTKASPLSGPTTASPAGSVPSQRIVSPSSPRRHRYLPSFILHVAEHLVGERPLSGTHDWDAEVTEILEGFVWSGERLRDEFTRIVGRVHEGVLRRAEEDEEEE